MMGETNYAEESIGLWSHALEMETSCNSVVLRSKPHPSSVKTAERIWKTGVDKWLVCNSVQYLCVLLRYKDWLLGFTKFSQPWICSRRRQVNGSHSSIAQVCLGFSIVCNRRNWGYPFVCHCKPREVTMQQIFGTIVLRPRTICVALKETQSGKNVRF